MNKDQVEGKVKDIGGRIERQVGEWTGDTKKQVQGTVKQVEGKVQNAWGNAKDASEQAAADEERAGQKNEPARESIETELSDEDEKERLRRKTG
jgi:uncharacterized protein YjbJ (UPF0337 family)